ncbi:MAG: Gfo/Idh/MocA family oxidoreductase [Gammaproteobacteria bacterium]|nr:Gfo/Idh/MocA family oxidoreductase [Gammaproteobacteria bacterium]
MSIKTAVIGTGYLGKFHAQKYAALDNSKLVAVVDTDVATANKIAHDNNCRAVTDYHELIGEVDAVSIASPTQSHYQIARDFLQRGTHVLVEKPITVTVAEADELIALAKQNQCVLQVGHLERFNPAIVALDKVLKEPVFIESHRLAPFKLRATDVNVILDLMIHDIDILLNLVRADIVDIAAKGARVLSGSTDIANARLTFSNGCVANVTASRVSLKSERKMRIFQNDAYITVDFQNRILSHHYKGEGESEPGIPRIESCEEVFAEADALRSEIAAFLDAIRHKQEPLVSGEDGRRALQTALLISDILG